MAHTFTPTDPATMPRPPFLDGFARMHAAMRRDSERLPRAIAAASGPGAGAALLRWFKSFRSTLEHHHEREDTVIWPELVRRDPSFAAPLAELLSDHEMLDAALATTEAALAGSGDPAHAAVELGDVLTEHLAREEGAAFPRLAACFPAEEWADVERSFMKGMSVGQLTFEIPWILDGLADDEIAELKAAAPLPLRAAYRLIFAPRYARVAAPVLLVAR